LQAARKEERPDEGKGNPAGPLDFALLRGEGRVKRRNASLPDLPAHTQVHNTIDLRRCLNRVQQPAQVGWQLRFASSPALATETRTEDAIKLESAEGGGWCT